MNKLIRIASGTIDILKEHKDGLAFAGSIAGTVATGITGVRSGIRIERKANKMRINNPNVTKKDIFKATWTELIPVVACGAGGIACNTAQFVSMKGKIEAAGATIATLSTQIDNLKKAEKEVLGEKKAEEIQKKAVEETINDIQKESPTGCCWFKDNYTGAEFYTSKEEIFRALNKLVSALSWQDQSVNDWLMYINKKDSRYNWNELGDLNGWEMGNVKLDIRFENGETSNKWPCFVIVFTKPPMILRKRCFD